MKLYSKSETLALPLTTGLHSVTGLGFTPKIVFFMSQPDTSDIVSTIANMFWSFGAFDGVNQWCRFGSSTNFAINQNTSNGLSISNVIKIHQPPGYLTFDYQIAAVSLDADGFTINVLDAPPINYRYSYLALGGATLETFAGWFRSAGGGQSITGVGFQPEAVLTAVTASFAALPAFNTQGNIWNMGLGTQPAYNPPYNFSYGAPTAHGVNPMQAKRYMDGGWAIDGVGVGGGTSFVGGGIMTFDPDGFTTGYFSNPTGYWIAYVALRGGPDIKFFGNQSLVGSVVGDHNITGVGFGPRVGLAFSIGDPVGAVGTNDAIHSMGWWANNYSDPNTQYVSLGYDRNGGSPSVTKHSSSANRMFRICNSAGVLTEDAKIKSINSDGFTMDMIITSGTPSKLGYLLIGDTDPIVPPATIADSYGIIV